MPAVRGGGVSGRRCAGVQEIKHGISGGSRDVAAVRGATARTSSGNRRRQNISCSGADASSSLQREEHDDAAVRPLEYDDVGSLLAPSRVRQANCEDFVHENRNRNNDYFKDVK